MVCVRVVAFVAALLLGCAVAMGEWLAPADVVREPPVGEREVSLIATALRLDAETLSAVEGIRDAAHEAHRVAWDELRAAGEAVRDAAVESSSMAPMADWAAARLRFQEERRGRRDRFFEDVRALLTAEQAVALDTLGPRLRRGASYGVGGVFQRRDVDLRRLVEVGGLGLDEREAVEPIVAAHEVELDPLIRERDALMGALAVRQVELLVEGEGDALARIEEFELMLNDSRPVELAIRDAVEAAAARIVGALPPEGAASFGASFRRALFVSDVFGPTPGSNAIAAAMGAEGLDEAQRRELLELMGDYRRDAAVLDERWESALRAWDRVVRYRDVLLSSPPPTEVRGAEAARRSLDARTMSKVRGVLREGQRGVLEGIDAEGR